MLHWLRIAGLVVAGFLIAAMAVRVLHISDELDRRTVINCAVGTDLRDALNDTIDGALKAGLPPESLAHLRRYANVPSPYCKAGA